MPRFDPVAVMLFGCCLNYLSQGSAVGLAHTSGHVSLCVEPRLAAVAFVTTSVACLSRILLLLYLLASLLLRVRQYGKISRGPFVLSRAPLLHSSCSREKEKSPSFQIL